MRFGSMDDLTARVEASLLEGERPVALVVGAGVAAGSIPGVRQVVNTIRASLDTNDALLLDARLKSVAPESARYQAAFEFLTLRKPPRTRDRIIQACTLKAYSRTLADRADLDAPKLSTYESEIDNWTLPTGLQAVGRIWSGLPEGRRGPIITTNFDPLCEIAIRQAGAQPVCRIIDEDGAFWTDLAGNFAPQVIHVHGYWRDSATLHLASELKLERPQLEGSLRSLLRTHTVVVIGYSGWSDAISSTLGKLMREQSSRDFDLLWCFFNERSVAEAEIDANETLQGLSRAPGSVSFYSEIDSNRFFPELERRVSGLLKFPDSQRSYAARTGLIGWISLSGQPVREISSTDHSSYALSFFDGRLPNWTDANNALIPRRDIANTLTNELKRLLTQPGSSLTLLTGASGEGKTTAALQAAASIVADMPTVTVLHNGEERLRSSKEVLALPEGIVYLLVIDEAFLSAEALRSTVQDLHSKTRSGIHILAISRDTDWRSTGGFTFPWSKYLPGRVHRLGGVSRLDATAIVQAWEAIGEDALGALTLLKGREARIQALEQSARNDEGTGGTLLGALLQTRYGTNLREHVRELLTRLDHIQIDGLRGDDSPSLMDAFFLAALPQANGVLTLSPELLAKSLEVDSFELHGRVLLPLGDEAAFTYNSVAVLTRHRLIARAALDLAPELGVDLGEVTERLVRAAVLLVEQHGMSPTLHTFAYFSQHLDSSLLGVRAAEVAVRQEPSRLSYRTSLSRALRKASDAQAAAIVAEESLPLIGQASDATTGVRPLLTEWGVVEGNLSHWARNCVLGGVAMQDSFSLGPLRADQLTTSFVCLAFAFRKLWTSRQALVFNHALHGVLDLANRLPLNQQQMHRLSEAEKDLRDGAVLEFRDPEAAAKAVADGCRAAVGLLEKEFPTSMVPLKFGFSDVVRKVKSYER